MDVQFTLEDAVNKLQSMKEQFKTDKKGLMRTRKAIGHDVLNMVNQLGLIGWCAPTTPEQEALAQEMVARRKILQDNVNTMLSYLSPQTTVTNDTGSIHVSVPPLTLAKDIAQAHFDDLTYLAGKQPLQETFAYKGGLSEQFKKYSPHIEIAMDKILYASNKLFAPRRDTYLIHIDTHELVRDLENKLEGQGITVEENLEEQAFTQDYASKTVFYLLDNAADHAFKDVDGKKRIDIHGKKTPDAYLLTIEDNGNGIDTKKFSCPNDIFNYGESTRAYDGGEHGIGLYLVKEFIEEQGGTITAQNKPEGGALFTLTIPKQ